MTFFFLIIVGYAMSSSMVIRWGSGLMLDFRLLRIIRDLRATTYIFSFIYIYTKKWGISYRAARNAQCFLNRRQHEVWIHLHLLPYLTPTVCEQLEGIVSYPILSYPMMLTKICSTISTMPKKPKWNGPRRSFFLRNQNFILFFTKNEWTWPWSSTVDLVLVNGIRASTSSLLINLSSDKFAIGIWNLWHRHQKYCMFFVSKL